MITISRDSFRWTSTITTSILAVVVGVSPLLADDSPAKNGKVAEKKLPGKKTNGQKTKRAEPRGRLPNFYARVVDEEQREKIYKIQQQFKSQSEQLDGQIRELRKQIKALREKQANKIAAVLSAEQLAEVNKLRKAAKKRRAENRKERAAKSGKSTPAESDS